MNPEIDDRRCAISSTARGWRGSPPPCTARRKASQLVLTTAPADRGDGSKIENYPASDRHPGQRSPDAAAGAGSADMTVASTVEKLLCYRRPYRIELANGRVVHARTIVVATGASTGRSRSRTSRFVGEGVYYAATYLEAQICGRGSDRGRRRQLAGQAAVFLAMVAGTCICSCGRRAGCICRAT
jgi:thioredoxin reductase (NADPH)